MARWIVWLFEHGATTKKNERGPHSLPTVKPGDGTVVRANVPSQRSQVYYPWHPPGRSPERFWPLCSPAVSEFSVALPINVGNVAAGAVDFLDALHADHGAIKYIIGKSDTPPQNHAADAARAFPTLIANQCERFVTATNT